MLRTVGVVCSVFVLAAWGCRVHADENLSETRQKAPLILAHYMPWFEADPSEDRWGWHWTMNAFDPSSSVDGQRPIASHFYPLAGPYDSGDPNVLEYQLLTMKLAGIDGVIVDWYGLEKFRDYPVLHRSTQSLVQQAQRLGMKVAICYEDQTIPALVKAGRIREDQRVQHARQELKWLAENWFSLDAYVKQNGFPLLLSFGQTGLTNEEWSQVLGVDSPDIAYFSQHFRRNAALGAFDWPVPREGLKAVHRFNRQAQAWDGFISVAYPRFVDIYKEARLHDSYGRVDDEAGKMFRDSFQAAVQSQAPIVQIATWNDWGEGTVIEPSVEYGYRDLEVIQSFRRKSNSSFAAVAADLKIPLQLLSARRRASGTARTELCDSISRLLATGKLSEARRLAKKLERQ